MNEQQRKAVAFALDYLSFIFLEREAAGKVRAAYLFGSAVRGELGKESDIDVFVDCAPKDEKLVKGAAARAETLFRQSADAKKWARLGFDRPLSVQVGPLVEWDAREGIRAEGLTLYSTTGQAAGGVRSVLFVIELPKKKAAYLSLIRVLFGREERGYRQDGLVQRVGGERMGAQVFMVPQEARRTVAETLHSQKVPYRMVDVSCLKV